MRERLPRWAEAAPPVVGHIRQDIELPSVCALRLSNVLRSGEHRVEMRQFATTLVARDLASRLAKGRQDTVDVLVELAGRRVVLRCPDSRVGLEPALRRIRQSHCPGRASSDLHGHPHGSSPRVPQCQSVRGQVVARAPPEQMGPFAKDIRFSSEPMEIVVSGLHAPVHQIKSLCVVTLNAAGFDGKRSTVRTRGTIGVGRDRTLVIVGVREEDEIEFLSKAGQIPEDIVESWRGPARAASTTRDCKRIIYAGGIKNEGAWVARLSTLLAKKGLRSL